MSTFSWNFEKPNDWLLFGIANSISGKGEIKTFFGTTSKDDQHRT